MKFFPLLWASLTRKPLRTGLTFLSAVMAFLLFGMMLGLNASVRHVIEVARLDCIYVEGRFGDELPLSQREQLLRLPHVVRVGYWGWVDGYYRNPKNSVGALMLDEQEPHIWTELPISAVQFQQMRRDRTGLFMSQASASRLGLSVGDKPWLPTRSTPWYP
jgi:putative ABC transport system permease protein